MLGTSIAIKRLISIFSKNFTEVIRVEYSKLDDNINLVKEIHNSFGSRSLGLIIIQNIPGYREARESFINKV